MSSSTITGRMAGRVTCQKRRQGPAPSMAAASYCCSSTWASAARKMIVPQPASFQMTWATTSGSKASGLPMMSTVCRPAPLRPLLSRPVSPSTCWKSATTITHEMKCGRYATDCTNRRTEDQVSVCSSRARPSGTGK